MPMKVLMLFAHPAFHKSRVNKLLVEGFSDIEGLTFHDLYQEYPELDIDIQREQELMEKHDVIVFHFPLFWYSSPAILKEWQDLVLEHGWAFGSKGNALKDKVFFCSITAGGPRKAYQEEGLHNHTMNQLLSPFRQTAMLCKMRPIPPFVVHGTHAIEKDEILESKNDLVELLKKFTSNSIDIDELSNYEDLNDYVSKQSV